VHYLTYDKAGTAVEQHLVISKDTVKSCNIW